MAFEQGTGGVGGGTFVTNTGGGGYSSSGGASPPIAPYGGGGGSAFSMPDFASLIANSPYVLAANALAAQQLSALKAQLGSSAARALVNLGDASLAGQVGNLDLPGDTEKLVSQGNEAGTSILAQLGRHHDLNTQSIPATLAGRGFYRSGETGYSLGEENRSYGQQQYNARSSTLDYLNGLYSNYLNAQFGIQQSQLSAEMAAYQSALSQIGMYVNPNAGAGGVAGPPVAPSLGSPLINHNAGGFGTYGGSGNFIG